MRLDMKSWLCVGGNGHSRCAPSLFSLLCLRDRARTASVGAPAEDALQPYRMPRSHLSCLCCREGTIAQVRRVSKTRPVATYRSFLASVRNHFRPYYAIAIAHYWIDEAGLYIT